MMTRASPAAKIRAKFSSRNAHAQRAGEPPQHQDRARPARIAGSAGTVNTGALDPLAEVPAAERLGFHDDGATAPSGCSTRRWPRAIRVGALRGLRPRRLQEGADEPEEGQEDPEEEHPPCPFLSVMKPSVNSSLLAVSSG
jgi:hypothetical protein